MNDNTDPITLPSGLAEKEAPDPINKRMAAAILRRRDGDALLLYLTDPETGAIEALNWENLPPEIRSAARAWAEDPLGVIPRYEQRCRPPMKDAA